MPSPRLLPRPASLLGPKMRSAIPRTMTPRHDQGGRLGQCERCSRRTQRSGALLLPIVSRDRWIAPRPLPWRGDSSAFVQQDLGIPRPLRVARCSFGNQAGPGYLAPRSSWAWGGLPQRCRYLYKRLHSSAVIMDTGVRDEHHARREGKRKVRWRRTWSDRKAVADLPDRPSVLNYLPTLQYPHPVIRLQQ
jgi:hypothetical protein